MPVPTPTALDLSAVKDSLTREHADLFNNLAPYLVDLKVDLTLRRLQPWRRPGVVVVLKGKVPRDLREGVPADFSGLRVRTVVVRASSLA